MKEKKNVEIILFFFLNIDAIHLIFTGNINLVHICEVLLTNEYDK